MIIDPKNRTQTIFDGGASREELQSELEEGLNAASEEMIRAIQNGDPGGFKEALRAFVEMCDEMPHEEGPHI